MEGYGSDLSAELTERFVPVKRPNFVLQLLRSTLNGVRNQGDLSFQRSDECKTNLPLRKNV
jgi:hypothetical protein